MFRNAGRTWWNCNLLQLENEQIEKTELLLNLIAICARYITSQWQKLKRTDSGKKLDDEVLHLVWAKSVYDRLSLELIRITFSFACKWALYEWVGRYPEVNHLHGTISRLFRPTFPKCSIISSWALSNCAHPSHCRWWVKKLINVLHPSGMSSTSATLDPIFYWKDHGK